MCKTISILTLIAWNLKMLMQHFETWKVVTGAYFKGCSYFAQISNFQLHSNFLMAVSSAQKYKPLQSRHNNAVIETTTPL